MLGDIASVATLVLFGMYFIGRIITIISVKSVVIDEINNYGGGEALNEKIIDEYTPMNGSDNQEYVSSIVLTAKQFIRSGKIVEYIFDDEMNAVDEKVVYEFKSINIGHSVLINVVLPECFANYRLEYITEDYKKVSLELTDNLKDGIMSECAYAKNTLKSFFYYLLK